MCDTWHSMRASKSVFPRLNRHPFSLHADLVGQFIPGYANTRSLRSTDHSAYILKTQSQTLDSSSPPFRFHLFQSLKTFNSVLILMPGYSGEPPFCHGVLRSEFHLGLDFDLDFFYI